MVKTEIEQIILKFLNAIISKGIHIEKVILYGSYASGKAHEDSDIDLAVVSSDFGKAQLHSGVEYMIVMYQV